MKYIIILFTAMLLTGCANEIINNNGNSTVDFDIYLSRHRGFFPRVNSYVIKKDGTSRRLFNDSLCVTSPSYKNKITMASIDSSGSFLNLLYSANSDGTGIVKIPKGSYYPVYLSLSPRGDKVLFTTDAGNYLCVVNIDGTGLIQISDGIRGTEQIPKFSPDGKQIAFFEALPNLTTGLYSIGTDGTNKKLLKDSIYYSAGFTLDWSSDGSKVVYQNKPHNSLPSKICTIDITGLNYEELANGENPSCSPFGDKICFLENVNQGIYDLFMMNSNGSGIVNLTNSQSEYDNPGSWSPEGEKILYTVGGNKVKLYDLNSQTTYNLTDSTFWAFWKY